jgi:hypothetical protein
MPVFDWLTVAGQIEDRQPDLPALTTPTAVNNNFTEASAPGISSQPNFMRYKTAIRTLARAVSEPASPDADPNKDTPPLMKHRFVYTFQSDAEYQWYSDQNTGHYSFQEFAFSGDEAIQFGSVIEEYVPASKRMAFPFVKRAFYGFIAHSCVVVDERKKGAPGVDPVTGKKVPAHTTKAPNDLRVTYPCDFGKLELKTHLALSHADNGDVIPFLYATDCRRLGYRFAGESAGLRRLSFPCSERHISAGGIRSSGLRPKWRSALLRRGQRRPDSLRPFLCSSASGCWCGRYSALWRHSRRPGTSHWEQGMEFTWVIT